MNMLNIGRMGLAAALGLAALAVRAAATMTEVWCSPTGLTTAAYTEADPGAFDVTAINKIVAGSAESPSVIHLLPGTYEIAGSANAYFIYKQDAKNFEVRGDVEDPSKVVLKGTGKTPKDDGTVVTNKCIISVGWGDYQWVRGITFTNFLCSESIVKYNKREDKSTAHGVENCVFEGNFGPGQAIYGGTVRNCTFRNNTNENATFSSASLVSRANVLDCLFEDNAGVTGVAVLDCNCSNTVFRANVATGDGGVMFVSQTVGYTVEACLFESNKAANSGVAKNNYNNRAVTFRNCRFVGNSATDSCGVAQTDGKFSFYDCSFVGNSAATNGGVFGGNSGAAVLANCVFTNNSAGVDYGVGKFNNTAISNCVFYGNKAGRNYGVGHLSQGSLSNAVFVGNFALTNATIYSQHNGGYNCVFTGNVSTNTLAWGAWRNTLVVSNRCEDGSYLFGNGGSLVNCTVVNNRGIAHASSASAVINSILVGNEPYDINRGAYARSFFNCIYGAYNGQYSPLTECQQVAGAEAVGFWWKDDGKQPFWGIGKDSIARDAGDSAKVPAGLEFDLAGRGRINGDAVDVGCYEWWKPESAGFTIIIR